MSDIITNQKQDLHINEIIRPYTKRWYWFILGIIISFFLGYLFLKKQTKIYQVQSTVLIKDSKNSSGGQDFEALRDLSGLGKIGSNGVDNEIEFFKSKKLMKEVVKQLGLETDVLQENNFTQAILYGVTTPIIVRVINEKQSNYFQEPITVKLDDSSVELSAPEMPTIKTTYNKVINLPFANIMITKNKSFDLSKLGNKDYENLKINVQLLDDRVEQLQSGLDVTLVNKDADVIKLTYNYPNANKAKAIVDKLVDVYNDDAVEDKNTESKKTAAFIEERIKVIGDDLGLVENQKERFKQVNQITDIETEARINLQTNAEARAKQIEIDSQLELNNALMSFLNKQGAYQVLPANVGLDNPGTITTINAYNQLVLQRNKLLENGTAENPVVVDLSKQINNIRNSVAESLQKNKNGLEIARNNYQVEQNKIFGKIAKVPSQEKLFRGIERQQQIKENLYILLLQKREETAISLAVTAPKARIVDYAFAGKSPIKPKPSIILASSIILGMMIPFALIYFLELFDNKVKTKHDLEKLSENRTILGEIPKLDRGQEELIKVNDLSPLAESFRILITNMNFMLKKTKESKVIFVTSTVKGEGKTFVSVNLSLTIASATKKVVVIGADLRNPQLQRYNVEKKGVAGLSEFLYDPTIKTEDIIHKTNINPFCDIIYSGSIPPNPTELLINGRIDELIERLKDIYDFIILDTAPLMLVTDSILISNLADVTVYVVRSNYSEKELIEFANNQIFANKIKNVGFVLNDVNQDYFGYGNKYGYGYGADNRGFFEKIKDRFIK